MNETVSTKPGEKTYVEQAQDMATNVYNQAAGAVNGTSFPVLSLFAC